MDSGYSDMSSSRRSSESYSTHDSNDHTLRALVGGATAALESLSLISSPVNSPVIHGKAHNQQQQPKEQFMNNPGRPVPGGILPIDHSGLGDSHDRIRKQTKSPHSLRRMQASTSNNVATNLDSQYLMLQQQQRQSPNATSLTLEQMANGSPNQHQMPHMPKDSTNQADILESYQQKIKQLQMIQQQQQEIQRQIMTRSESDFSNSNQQQRSLQGTGDVPHVIYPAQVRLTDPQLQPKYNVNFNADQNPIPQQAVLHQAKTMNMSTVTPIQVSPSDFIKHQPQNSVISKLSHEGSYMVSPTGFNGPSATESYGSGITHNMARPGPSYIPSNLQTSPTNQYVSKNTVDAVAFQRPPSAQDNHIGVINWETMPEPLVGRTDRTDPQVSQVLSSPVTAFNSDVARLSSDGRFDKNDSNAYYYTSMFQHQQQPIQQQRQTAVFLNSTHPLIHHAVSDPIPQLFANRRVVEVTILLGPRGHRAPPLAAQLQAQQPPSAFPEVRLLASSVNRYAGVGEYWDAADSHVVIEGNVPLAKSVKRLKSAVSRAEKVREHVLRNGDISMPMMGLMTSTCEDLCASTEEMSVDFEGEGGIAAILATCAGWTYKGSDDIFATPQDFEPIWDKQFAVSTIVAQVRIELVEPMTDFVTPFASAMCARSRARNGDPESAMMTLLTYESRRGGPKIAHWVVLRSWGVGTGALRVGDALGASWIDAECSLRGGGGMGGLSHANVNAPTTTSLSLTPDTTGTLSWSLFSRVSPPLQLTTAVAHSMGTGLYSDALESSSAAIGVMLKPGEYHLIHSIHSRATLMTKMEALMRVIALAGSKVAMAACGYPHMPDGISPSAVRDMCSFSTRRSRPAFAALAGVMMARGKKEAIRALLSAVSLSARMGDKWETQELMVREACDGGGILLHSVGLEDVLQREGKNRRTSWLCLSGGRIRMVLVCTGAKGNVKCLGTATYVGSLQGPPDGPGVFIS